MIKDQINQDLKQAMLGGDAERVTVLRGIKSVILDAEIASGTRHEGMADDAVIALLQKEAKKRHDTAEVYVQAQDQARADKELREKQIIEAYLPAQLSEEEVATLVEKAIADLGATDVKAMGQVIAQVKTAAKGAADGGVIARITKEKLGV